MQEQDGITSIQIRKKNYFRFLAIVMILYSIYDIFYLQGGMYGLLSQIGRETKSVVKLHEYDIPLFSTVVDSVDYVSLKAQGHTLNNSYHLQSEVESITHVPNEAKVVVRFKSTTTERKCKKPRILGRLSGEYLSRIHWDADAIEKINGDLPPENVTVKTFFNHTETLNVITGYYNIPKKGRYFIEILGLFCNDFPFDYDFNQACLENVDHNQLTAPGAFVDVSKTSLNLNDLPAFRSSFATNGAAKVLGHWKWSNETMEPVPLVTRYQRQNCRENSAKPVCKETASTERFEPYSFEWLGGPQFSHLENYTYKGGNGAFKICSVGESHSRVMTKHWNNVIKDYNISNVVIEQMQLRYPRHMLGLTRVWKRHLFACNVILVGFGQWSAGKKSIYVAPATTFPEYYSEWKQGLDYWMSLNLNVVIRKTHYNAMGDLANMCPPTDWRNPAVIDTYNEIIRRLSRERNLTFLDTGYLVDPMWDYMSDYCHYYGLPGRLEALYFLEKLLPPWNPSPKIDADGFLTDLYSHTIGEWQRSWNIGGS